MHDIISLDKLECLYQRKVDVNMNDNIVLMTMQLIKDKYSVSEDTAWKYAKLALDALESHGGTRTDFNSVIEIVDVVVKSWLESDKHE